MKQILFAAAMLAGAFARAQTADPFINVLVSPASIQQQGIGLVNVTLANYGNSDIVANSLEAVIIAGPSAQILGLDPLSVNDSRWTVVSLGSGSNNTIVLRNNTTIPESDGGIINLRIQGNAVTTSSLVSGIIDYIPGSNPILGGAQSDIQGNGQTDNDDSYSSLAVTPAAPLPVQLVSFAGEAAGCQALLRWKTADETGIAYYEVQASADGRSYVPAGRVESRPGASNSYDFRHAQPAGRTQYRLRIVGLDGQATYSQTAVVATDCNSSALTVYPNPASSTLHVSGLDAADGLSLLDATGRVVLQQRVEGAAASLDISRLPAGSYTLTVSGNRPESKMITIVR